MRGRTRKANDEEVKQRFNGREEHVPSAGGERGCWGGALPAAGDEEDGQHPVRGEVNSECGQECGERPVGRSPRQKVVGARSGDLQEQGASRRGTSGSSRPQRALMDEGGADAARQSDMDKENDGRFRCLVAGLRAPKAEGRFGIIRNMKELHWRRAGNADVDVCFGHVICSEDPDGEHTICYDENHCLDALARLIDKERLAACERIVEDVLAGKKLVVEIVGDLRRTTEVAQAIFNTVYSRMSKSFPMMMSSVTTGEYQSEVERCQPESEWVENIETIRPHDLYILETDEWLVGELDLSEASICASSCYEGYRTFKKLLADRMESWQTHEFRSVDLKGAFDKGLLGGIRKFFRRLNKR